MFTFTRERKSSVLRKILSLNSQEDYLRTSNVLSSITLIIFRISPLWDQTVEVIVLLEGVYASVNPSTNPAALDWC